nr:MAG TPA: minor capsid protein [Caudoviricetes sp.]
MLTSEQIDRLRDLSGQITDPINNFLIEDIARRISEAGQLTSTAAYQVWRAQNLGISRREVKKRLRKLLKVSHRELRQLLTQSAEVGYDFDIKRLPFVQAVPFEQNAALQRILSAAVAMAGEELDNLTRTLGMVDPFGNALPLQDVYRKSCDFAFEQVFTGATDYNTAMRRATANIAKHGVRIIDYESGVHTSLEAAVRRNIMGGLGLMQEQISRQAHDDMGADGWEISAHAASAPDHEPIQGLQYSDREYEELNNSLVRRIGTLNCGHAAYPIILGISRPQYTPEELEKFKADNATGIDYQGRHYTMYEATQMQRKLERHMRTQKRRILVDEATGDKEKLQTDQIRYVRLNGEYARFSRAAGLRTQQERAEVGGFGPKQARAAGEAVSDKTSWQRMQTAIGENAPKSLAEFKQIKYTGGERWRQLMESQHLFEKIDKTDTYSPEYKTKMKETYQYFLDYGFEFREHAINRVLGQKTSSGKFSFTREMLLGVLNRASNYRQADGKLVRFYDGLSVISAEDTGEIVSVVVRNSARKDWEVL